MKLFDTDHCRALDQTIQKDENLPGLVLMKKAAWCAYQTIKDHFPNATKLSVFCGSGNNGGDGLFLAQYAYLDGCDVEIIVLTETDRLGEKLPAAAQQGWLEATALNLTLRPLNDITPESLKQRDLCIDALLGTGLNRDVTHDYADAIALINSSPLPVVSLDVPSGLDATTGHIWGHAIQADLTLTFIAYKTGLFSYLGPSVRGKCVLCSLNIETENYPQISPLATSHSLEFWQAHLSKRTPHWHKGNAGTSWLVGGNHHMMGAIVLAGQACLKAGSGLTKIVSRSEHLIPITSATPELMTYEHSQAFQGANAVAIGPGLGQDDWAKKQFSDALSWHWKDPTHALVMDADALSLLANHPLNGSKTAHWILTPHPKEAAVLLNWDTHQVQSNRFDAIKTLHKRYGGVIVLKGNGTLIFDGDRMELCPFGNPAMAVGGMGDVLTGLICAYLAQGMALFDAACLGVYQHASLADKWVAQGRTEASLTPSDMIHSLQ